MNKPINSEERAEEEGGSGEARKANCGGDGESGR